MTEITKSSAGLRGQQPADESARLMHMATYAAVLTAGLLVVIKSGAWWVTGSVSLLGSLMDSGLDVIASTINMVAVRHSLIPRDHEHRFGHGKAEALAGLGQSLIVFVSAFYLIYHCYDRIVDPRAVEQTTIGIAAIVISIILTLGLVRFQQTVIAKSGSLAIAADQLHYKSDLLMNLAVIGALILSGLEGLPFIDPLIGVGIAFYILLASWRIAFQSFDQLMDRELPNEMRNCIRQTAITHPEVRDVHDLRTRSSGASDFIQLHLELDPLITLVEAHRIADEVEADLMKLFPRAQIIIHQDPADHEEVPALDKR
jgi:ferrous-iron efflux pump FieF